VPTYATLLKRLGRPTRFVINLPRLREGTGDVGVRWRCGCRADGETLRDITLRACPDHAAAPNEDRNRFVPEFAGDWMIG
jgi:hypothetical protein